MTHLNALLRILLEGQAYLYAKIKSYTAALVGEEWTEEEFQKWMDEWMEETDKQLKELTDESN